MKTRENTIESDRFYHIFNRGIDSKKVFLNNENFSFFLRKTEKYILPIFDIYAYCLMPNHFHFILKPKSNLIFEENFREKGLHSADSVFSKTIGKLISSYSQSFNKVYQRTGPLFESPFKRIEIDSENYLRNLIIYIHQNPDDFQNYKFSSYRAILSNSETSLKRNEIIFLFDDLENFKFCHLEKIEI